MSYKINNETRKKISLLSIEDLEQFEEKPPYFGIYEKIDKNA